MMLDKREFESLAELDYEIEDLSSDDEIYSLRTFMIQEDRQYRMDLKGNKVK